MAENPHTVAKITVFFSFKVTPSGTFHGDEAQYSKLLSSLVK